MNLFDEIYEERIAIAGDTERGRDIAHCEAAKAVFLCYFGEELKHCVCGLHEEMAKVE